MVDPRYIGVFHEVVRTGSYSAAARELGYSQPAISQQMRALQRSVGTPLFTRCGRSLRLTEAGEILARHATAVVEDLTAAGNKLEAVRELRSGAIRVCAFPSASATLVPTAVARATERYPGLRVRLTEAEPPDSLDALRRGECDVALAFDYPGSEDLVRDEIVGSTVLDDPVVVLLPGGHDLARRSEVDLAELADERWIAGCRRCREHFVRSCEAAGFAPDVAFTTDDNLAVQGLVAAGVGVALMPELVLSFLRHPEVVGRRVAPRDHRRISAYALRDQVGIPAADLMLRTLRDVGAEMAGSPDGGSPHEPHS